MIDYVLEMNHLTKEKPNDRYAHSTTFNVIFTVVA
jgi:hypothetical protein